MNMVSLVNFLTTIDTEGISNSDVNAALGKLLEIVNMILIIIYVVLGLFLVIKGALLGMQIVKAADEPQVRQEKIGSLKWLVIGVAIAYGVTGIAHIVTGFFREELGSF